MITDGAMGEDVCVCMCVRVRQREIKRLKGKCEYMEWESDMEFWP